MEDDDEAPRGPLYISVEGAEQLQRELKHLLTVERPKVTGEVSVAAAQGDRSENAEYIYGKRRLREIDRRIRFLTRRIERATVVDTRAPADVHRVYFGATVGLEEAEEGTRKFWTLVGPDETDATRGRISIDGPLARAVLGRRVGDTVTVRRPAGELEVTIVSITYPSAVKRDT